MVGSVLFLVRVEAGGLDTVMDRLLALNLGAHIAPSGRRELLVLAELADAGDAGRVARALADLEKVQSVSCCPEPAA